MSYVRLALILGLLALVGLCVLAGIGFTPAIPVLVTVALLVLFVGAGNFLSGRPSTPRFSRPPAGEDPAEDSTVVPHAGPSDHSPADGAS